MELALIFIISFMIIAAIVAIHARDLLSAIIAQGFAGYGLVICFLLLKAPDLAIVQIVVETITLIIMVAIVMDSSRQVSSGFSDRQSWTSSLVAVVSAVILLWFFHDAISLLSAFGEGHLRMSEAYITGAVEKTGSINPVTGILFDFRGYDTLGEATVLFAAVMGVLTIIRLSGKK